MRYWPLPPVVMGWILLVGAVLIGNAAISFRNVTAMRENQAVVEQTYKANVALERLIASLTSAETGQRGYLLTSDAAYLAPYTESIARVGLLYDEVRALTDASPTNQRRLDELERRIAAKLAELQDTIDLREARGLAAAMAIVNSDRGRVEMDAIRAIIGEMEDDQRQLLAQRRAEFEASSEVTSLGFGLASLASLILLAFLGVSFQRDLRRRQRATEQIQLERERLKITLGSIGDAVIATDTGGRIVMMNMVAEELTGWPSAEAAGRSLTEVFQIVNESTRQTVESPADRALQEGVVVGLANHTLLVRRDGTDIPIDDSAAPIRNGAGVVSGVVLVFRDVSQRHREVHHQRLLAEATATLAESLDYSTTLARVVDLLVPTVGEMCVLYLAGVDGAIMRVASAHVDPVMAAQLRVLRADPVEPDGPHPAAVVIRSGKTLVNPAITPSVLSTVPPDTASPEQLRALVPMSQVLAPLVSRQHIIGALAVGSQHEARLADPSAVALIEELARRIALAVENARLYRDMQEAVRLRDTFLSIASHELKTPLTSLLGQAQLLQRRTIREGSLGSRDMRALQVIVDQANRLNRRIASMLDISQIEQGRLGIVRAPVDLASLIGQVADELQLTLGDHRLTLELEPAPMIMSGDALRLEQVIQNLLSNAVKYTPDSGEIVIRLTRRADMAYIAVIDRGIGIPQSAQPHIFDRYYRAENVETSHVSGVGIGLYLVWEIVALHGGTIEVQSEVGLGSTFTVALPLDTRPAPAEGP